MLYLPVKERLDGGQDALIRQLADGRMALLAYTALDRLAEKCGPNQAWIVVSTPNLDRVKELQPFEVVAFDLEIPQNLRVDGRVA